MKRALTSAVFLLWLLSGCARMSVDMRGLEPHVHLSGDARGEVTALGDFRESTRSSWLLWGLVELQDAAPARVVARALERAGGDAVVRLRITTQRTLLDSAVTLVTLGLYTQRTMRLEGVVVGVAPAEPPP